ncbi:MAG: hypothetical protein ACQEW9_03090 [Bacteroidota bacterium]|uniref:Uncharacterized protein n=1 Tax=Algoriphagus faecimaris TaxID=686796 RepID=A0A1G6WW41_9BACT|nr:hypothetical protein [Algoriphagus faecimaris]SDD70112.1 hypothetical protein SAMN04488104_104827 [Algoriphagus faecimaris]
MWDDFDDEDPDFDEEGSFDYHKDQERVYKHPLMKKARDIVGLTKALVGSLDEARRELYGTLMLEDSLSLTAKFSAAENSSDYVIKMEKAMLIKIHAKSLFSITYQLALEETHAEEHLQLLREAIEEYRKLFLDWIKEFDSKDRTDDGWGIFTG